MVQAAVEVYANTEDADPDIVDQLRRTVADSVVKKMFLISVMLPQRFAFLPQKNDIENEASVYQF